MEHNYNDIDELFQSSFENFEVEPPTELKAAIDKQLKFKTNRKLGRIWYLGILFFALITSAIVFLSLRDSRTVLSQNSTQKKEETKQTKIPKNKANQLTTTDSLNNVSNTYSQSNETHKSDSTKVQDINKVEKSQSIYTKVKSPNTSALVQKNNVEKQNTKKKKARSRKSKNNSGLLNSNLSKQDISLTKKVNMLQSEEVNEDSQSTSSATTQLDSDSKSANSALTSNQENKDSSNIISVAQRDIHTTDSIQNNSNSGKSQNNKRKIPLLLSFKTDYVVPFNKKSNEEEFKSKNSFHVQLEASYLIRHNFVATFVINYLASNKSYTKTTTSSDSTFIGYTTNYIYADSMHYFLDSLNQGTIDSVLVTYISDSTNTANYELTTVTSANTSSFKISSFSIPIMFYYSQKINTKVYLDLNGGVLLNFQKIRFTDTSNPLNSDLSLSKFGVKAILKTSLRYQFSHFGVSLNNNFLYDLAPIQTNSGKRKVLNYGIGLGVSWQF